MDKDCTCQNWLKHWMASQHKEERPNCSVYNCTSEALVGGHVVLTDDIRKDVYITPMCLYHNTVRGKLLELCFDTVLESPCLLETCEPKPDY